MIYTVFFWLNVAPGMLLGAWVVRRHGVGRALAAYALALASPRSQPPDSAAAAALTSC